MVPLHIQIYAHSNVNHAEFNCTLSEMCKKTLTFVGIKAALQGVPRISADVVTTARFSLRPAAIPPGSQTGVCGDEKVSQTPSGGWSDFDTRPITQPHPPHTQMGNISGQIASGQTTSFNNIFNIFRGLFNKTDGVFCGANNATFDNVRRSAVC